MNPAYTSWLTTDQTLLSLLYSSLTEESMSEVLGLSHAHKAWTTLEASFSHRSKTRELQLKDELQLMQRGSKSMAEFSWLFKGLCNQLAAIGRPIDDLDKVHWFLRALGPDYKIFSTTMLSQLPLPFFCRYHSKSFESWDLWTIVVPTIYQLNVLRSTKQFHQTKKHREREAQTFHCLYLKIAPLFSYL